MAIRSAVLAASRITDTGSHTICTCPAATSLIVKDVRFTNYAAAIGNLQLRVYRTNAADANFLYQSVAVGAVLGWGGWVMLEPTDLIVVQFSVQPYTVWISGTVLDGVALATEQNIFMTTQPA